VHLEKREIAKRTFARSSTPKRTASKGESKSLFEALVQRTLSPVFLNEHTATAYRRELLEEAEPPLVSLLRTTRCRIDRRVSPAGQREAESQFDCIAEL
jgi:hypothetical protein